MQDCEETYRLAEQSRLMQRCPACGTHEAAGSSCTACGAATGPADWQREARAGRPPKSAGKPASDFAGAAKRVVVASASTLTLWGAL